MSKRSVHGLLGNFIFLWIRALAERGGSILSFISRPRSYLRLPFILVVVTVGVWGHGGLRSEIIYDQKDFTLEQEEYLSLFETTDLGDLDIEGKIKETFGLLPMYSNILISIKAPPEVLDNMFSDLHYTIEKGRLYSRTKYEIEKQTSRWFNVAEPPSMKGSLYIIYLNKEEHRYIYFVEGAYKTFTTLNGKMIVDVSFRDIEGTQYFNVKSYTVLSNKFFWEMARIFAIFPSFRKKIEGLIEQNINYVVKVGKHTALSINKYEYQTAAKEANESSK